MSSKKLDELQQNFDTTKILADVDTIDEICSSICDLDGIKLELRASPFNGSHNHQWGFNN
ncbi:hypothetical protein [Scytonema sp. NUACC26]|uniref:hypothetical protein n=1 Tax=Scytonema sp. NUACC26 TaxID=3140176 RepID=UPI0038B2E177